MAYQHALVVDESSSEQRLTLAGELLARCEGSVVLDGVVAMRATQDEIICDVIELSPTLRRSAEAYSAMVDNAARGLQESRLRSYLPDRTLRWFVVDDYGMGALELWHAP